MIIVDYKTMSFDSVDNKTLNFMSPLSFVHDVFYVWNAHFYIC